MGVMKERVRPTAAYARAHYAARKLVGPACERCGATAKLQAALRPETPAERLALDPNINCMYSAEPTDYFTLCVQCHRQLDRVELRPNCKNAHPYTPENTSIKTDGSRRCLTCHRDAQAQRMTDETAREAKRALDRKRVPTPEQKARKIALQRLRRQKAKS